MRKSILFIATTALSGVIFSRAAAADTNGYNSTQQPHASTGVRTNANGEPCPPHRVLTPEQRRLRAEAAQRARDRRLAEEQDRLAEAQRLRDAAAQAQNDAAAARDQAAQAQSAADAARAQQLATQQELDAARGREQRLSAYLVQHTRADEMHRRHLRIVSRGGGPLHYRPMFTFGFDGGVAGFAGSTNRQETYTGGTWGARIGVDFANWFGIEGRYFGMANALFPPNVGAGTLVTNGGTGVVRFTVPTRFVQPYVFGGAGVYNSQVYRPAGSGDANTIVAAAGNRFAVPLGVGLNIPIGRVVSVGAEGTYHALWNIDNPSTMSTVREFTNGIWNGTAVLRFRL